MAKVITIGMGKGGVGKTTACSLISYFIRQGGYKILGVDFDPQGNFTQMSTRRSLFDFEDRTIFEAMKEKNPRPYICNVDSNFHILPTDDYLAYLSKYLYTEYTGDPYSLLKETLEPIQDEYDFIIIDLPPNLGDHTINGLNAADHAVAIFQPEPFCYDGLERYIDTILQIKEGLNPKLNILGIITSMMDPVASIDEITYQKAKKEYPGMLFETVIKRRARVKEYSLIGVQQTTSRDQMVLHPYAELTREVLARVKKKEAVR